MKAVSLIFFSILFATSAGAGRPTRPNPLKTACLANRSESRLQPNQTRCRCVVESLTQALTDTHESDAKREWLEKVFRDEVTQAEFEQDKYHLVEYLNGV